MPYARQNSASDLRIWRNGEIKKLFLFLWKIYSKVFSAFFNGDARSEAKVDLSGFRNFKLKRFLEIQVLQIESWSNLFIKVKRWIDLLSRKKEHSFFPFSSQTLFQSAKSVSHFTWTTHAGEVRSELFHFSLVHVLIKTRSINTEIINEKF